MHWRSLHPTSGVFCLSFIAFMHAASATFRVQVKSFFLLFCNLENWWSHTPYKIWTYCQKKKACEKNSQKERYGWGKGVEARYIPNHFREKKSRFSPWKISTFMSGWGGLTQKSGPIFSKYKGGVREEWWAKLIRNIELYTLWNTLVKYAY